MTTYTWTIDDAGMGGSEMVESFQRTCQHFESRHLRATWFIVPKPNRNPLSAEWKDAFRAARDAGQDLQLHGLTHEDCYEFGPPAWPATSILPSLSDKFVQQRDELMPRYTLDNLRARLEEGMEILQRELDTVPTFFRAPCGAISKPMFQALRQVGISYHSGTYISATGYEHLPHRSGVLTHNWPEEVPRRPFPWYSDVIEAPILNEYTWRGAWQREEDFIELAKQDIDRIESESPVAVLLMHTHGIADHYDYAFRLVDAVIEHIGQKEQSSFSTLGELVRSGALAAAAGEAGPDNLSI